MFAQALRTLFLPQKCFALCPRHDELARLYIVNQPGVGVDPFDLPLVSSNMEMNEGTLSKPDPRTLAEFLNQWLAEYATRKVAPKTLERYRDLARHVTRAIGGAQLTKVTTLQLQRVYNSLLDSGKKGGSGLSVKSVRHVHGMMHVAFETALTWGLLKINPAHACDFAAGSAEREARAMDHRETALFMEVCGDTGCATSLLRPSRRVPAVANCWALPGRT